jgi:carbon monoxide dehydrogenase subunit G
MQVNLDKVFALAAPADSGWQCLQDIPGVAACMPGAEITETIDASHYQGKVKTRIGPATMEFAGDIEVKSMDGERRELHLIGRGQDTKGTSSAEMDLAAAIVAVDAESCELRGRATVTVNGKAASLGGRMMTQVADRILDQFGDNFTNNVLALGKGVAAAHAREQLAQRPRELNGLALVWSVILGFFRNLFGGGKAKAG